VRPRGAHIGLVTLNNVFEVIENASADTPAAGPAGGRQRIDSDMKKLAKRAGVQRGAIQILGNQTLSDADAPSMQENLLLAVLAFLQATQPCFSSEHISEEELLQLLRASSIETSPAVGTLLYQRNVSQAVATIVLQGLVEVRSGAEDLVSQIGPWGCIAMRSLEPPFGLLCALQSSGRPEMVLSHDAHDYMPDYEARVLSGDCRLLRISRKAYLEAYCKSHLSKGHTTRSKSKDLAVARTVSSTSPP